MARIAAAARSAALALALGVLGGAAPSAAHDSTPAATPQTPAPGPSTRVFVSGRVKAPADLDAVAISKLPRSTLVANGRTYAGVLLRDLLDTVGVVEDPSIRNERGRMYVVARGSDGYTAVVAMGEIDPKLGNRPVLVAWEVDGAPLGAAGYARLVVPGDVHPARAVARLAHLEVRSIRDAP